MGAFFSVLILSGEPLSSDAAVKAWLTDSALLEGHRLSGTCTTFVMGESATGVVGPPVPLGNPGEAAAHLSNFSNGPVIGIDVHDSDLLTLGLWEEGVAVQILEVGPVVTEPLPDLNPAWEKLLLPGKTLHDFSASLATPAVFAEEVLARAGESMGWFTDRLVLSEEDLPDVLSRYPIYRTGISGSLTDPVAESVTDLVTDLVTDPLTNPANEPATEQGPAQLGHRGGIHEVVAKVGGQLTAQIIAHSVSSPGSRLTVMAWGEALDKGLIEPQAIQLMTGYPTGLQPQYHTDVTPGDNPVAYSFGVEIPAGFPEMSLFFQQLGAKEGMKKWLETRFEATLVAKALKPGAETLHLALLPEDDHDRAVTWSVEVVIN